MSVYLIFDIKITDPVKFEEYRKLVPPIIARFGGKYLVRGGLAENLEGEWIPDRIVILEFTSAQVAKDFLDSAEYAPVKLIRHQASTSRGIMVEAIG